ncbi:hypothetical protein SODALDRAFT_332095 [Sodiomyces alkalinus F11]|uniref:Oxidoreductase n=1 Tax=Sodiomyces alkalinus (strain CBS 110278 / VKM F-3762 / F11) TaxID=1314773 RepID=A0A3N2PZL6_SODAK|nr:hypothetical protein SODALDRAFT_332095 [Sodiomyces alkalinus F11]ROT39947.1 hypothetical protein SODALDRAFT_332095 [Sodiomyces alkalinus F11]
MSQQKPPVSFIGLGAMGFGMATHLVKEGYPVTGFDVYGPTLERFAQAGGKPATTPSEAVADKDYCVCMVATAQQAQSVLLDSENAAIQTLPRGAVVLLCSTVPCSYVQALEKDLAARGRPDVLLVDCPVSGGAGRAAAGTLSIMAGASDDAALEKGKDLLQAMSDPAKLYIVQGGIGAGSNMKMCHQVLAANQILSAGEALGFAAHLGLDLNRAAEGILGSDGWSWMFENRLPRILDANHQPIASATTIILKDTSIITHEARAAGFATPMTTAAEQVYFASLGRGYGPDDDAGLIRMYTEGVGRVGPVQGAAQTEHDKLALVVDLLRGVHLCSAAETLAFAHFVGLDLDQVFELCINAAGGSRMLSTVGPEIIRRLRGEGGAGRAATEGSSSGGESLSSIAARLSAAVDEAQRLKVPVFLGSSALNLIRQALRRSAGKEGSESSLQSVVGVWT